MKKIWLILLLLFSLRAGATHIVGGEFELVHVQGSNYHLTLNLYFDDVTGSPGAVDQSVTVRVFEKSTNAFVEDIFMPLQSSTFVPYTNIDCTIGSLRTKKLVYDQQIILPANRYSSPNGYYVVWERCCRNISINNIVQPQAAGQAFYMEFPPVTIVNSSPKLFPPLSDYGCVGQLFYFDFAGTDPDGDSLVYEMVTPLNGYSSSGVPLPTPSPAPYPEVSWLPGYNVNNQIIGNPSMRIDRQTGFLQVQPNSQGLFVFGVRCSEYRNGVKIGEVRREFQMLVVACPTNDRPSIQVKKPGVSTPYQPGDTIRISGSTNRCLDLFMSDLDPDENLTAYVRPVNFTLNDQLLSNNQGMVNRGGIKDTLVGTLCFPNCFSTDGKAYMMDVIVKDDGCSLPKQDTVRITFVVDPIPNQPPQISAPAAFSGTIGTIIQFDVTGTDPDNDVVTITAAGRNFTLSSQNIQFSPPTGTGSATGTFRWELDCQAMSQQQYIVDFTVSSVSCGITSSSTVSVEINTSYTNNPPGIALDVTDTIITIPYNQLFTTKILGTDPDNHPITITAAGEHFDLAALGMQFTPANGQGSAETTFSWTPDCRAFDRGGSFRIRFSVAEVACQAHAPRTRTLELRVLKPEIKPFIPPNIFTPNNDGLNDFFEMPSLPPDFCESVFSSIKIYNRWGSQVFKSSDRNFRWDGKNASDGVYYYQVEYTDKKFKGYVELVK